MRILGENVICLKYNVTFISMQKQTLNHCNFLYANFIKKKKITLEGNNDPDEVLSGKGSAERMMMLNTGM